MYRIDILPFGVIGLIIYVIIDLIKIRRKSFIKRVLFYSFILYLINVFRVTTGGISIPPSKYSAVDFQLIPFSFIIDWTREY
ncbi:hypothetical protein [Serpentinicella alkaliphila]|uniref:Uncharacterized protein n=1 Tax=Serpentinicella alkaliphila TaxID=1734049 RepID=A0A4R2TEN1_9FIRM|nr:hypothetical protein [Serpentinicella alkaliphila]TCQ01980.1 hypothetical protein EDD79_102036 [Serpentinicella alkaliphila]